MAAQSNKTPSVWRGDVEGFGAMRQHLPSVASLLIAAALVAALSGESCTTHGEGGRCDHNNTTATNVAPDCDPGLICVPKEQLTLPEGGTSGADICCPMDPTARAALTDICAQAPNTPGNDGGIPDGGFEASSPIDASTDQTVTDAPEDTTSDAPDDVIDDVVDDGG
jgi:hypothetical protein